MNKFLLAIIFSVTFILSGFSQGNKVNWISFEKMEELQKTQERPVLLDFYTDWCGWCKRMDATTYSDPNVVSYVNQNFYAVKFNAETKDSITYQGTTYVNSAFENVPDSMKHRVKRATHDLAAKLLPGRRSYPTTVFLFNNLKGSVNIGGYLKSDQIFPYLSYFADRMYNSVHIETYARDFNEAFFSSPKPELVKWNDLETALALQKKNPKKIFVHIAHNGSLADRVMTNKTFRDSTVAQYLNDNFICVRFDALSQDSVTFQGNTFVNTSKTGIHQLAAGMMRNNISFPCSVILNEQGAVITPISQYFSTSDIIPMLIFFNENRYTTTKYQDFLKEYNAAH